MKYYKKGVVIFLLLILSVPSMAWRKQGDTLYLDKGDNVWDVSYSLLGDGTKWELLWDLRVDKGIDLPVQAYPNMKFTLNDSIFHKTQLIYVDTLHFISDTAFRINPYKMQVEYIVTEKKDSSVIWDKVLAIILALIPFILPLILAKYVENDKIKSFLFKTAIIAMYVIIAIVIIILIKWVINEPFLNSGKTQTSFNSTPLIPDTIYLKTDSYNMDFYKSIDQTVISEKPLYSDSIGLIENSIPKDTIIGFPKKVNVNVIGKVGVSDPPSELHLKGIFASFGIFFIIIIVLISVIGLFLLSALIQRRKSITSAEIEAKRKMLIQVNSLEKVLKINKPNNLKGSKLGWSNTDKSEDVKAKTKNSIKSFKTTLKTEGLIIYNRRSYNQLAYNINLLEHAANELINEIDLFNQEINIEERKSINTIIEYLNFGITDTVYKIKSLTSGVEIAKKEHLSNTKEVKNLWRSFKNDQKVKFEER